MASRVEKVAPRRTEGDFYLTLRSDVFNVDYLSMHRDLTSDIRHGITEQIQKNWPHVIRERYRDEIDLSRVLLEEGREIIIDVLEPSSYGNSDITLAVGMAYSGDDPLKIQNVLDRVEDPYPIGDVNFKREIMATAYMVNAFKAKTYGHKELSRQMLDAGIPLLAQCVAARRQAAQR